MDKELIAKVFIKETENLKENSQYGIYLSNDEFKKFFVEPFTDVLKVAKIALKDVGTGVLYNLRILFINNVLSIIQLSALPLLCC